jgi:hypothetical protein
MASRVEHSVEIQRRVDQVFAFVDDYRNTTRYMVGLSEWRPVGEKTQGKGSRFALTKRTPGVPDIKSEVEITGWTKNKLIGFESYSGFENSGSYEFVAGGDKTVVRLINTYDIASVLGGGRGGVFGGLARRVGGAAGKALEGPVLRDLEKSLQNLKRLVEKETAGVPSVQAQRSRAGATRKAPARKRPAKP